MEAGGQVSIDETLNCLPALRSTMSQANSTGNIGTAGISALDLRGLDSARTLVLVSGRRHVSGMPGDNDIGTRAEKHKRETYRVVGGVKGEIAQTGNWNYDLFVNYGRTKTYYETSGTVDIRKFNNAANAVRNGAGEIVCRIIADSHPNNDDANCRSLNLFGLGAPSNTPEGIKYVLHTFSRREWPEQVDAAAVISGNTEGFFTLPGGPVGIALGVEYRSEDYFSAVLQVWMILTLASLAMAS